MNCEICGRGDHVPGGIHCAGSPKPGFRTPPKGSLAGLDVIQGTKTAEIAAALRDVTLEKALAAREDVCAFFEFVMRAETTQKPVKITPHQRLMFEFLQAHDRAVLILPVEHAKTFVLATYTLWLVGRNPSLRGAVVSATQMQAAKILNLVREYIEGSAELKLVFPDLRPNTREGNTWTQSAITVDRPRGIKDPTLMAVGLDGGRIIGSRLSWIVADDVLTPENTATDDARKKVIDYLDNACFSRLIYGPETKAIVSNSPWHSHDAVGTYSSNGWATLRMSVDGEINIKDDKQKEDVARQFDLPWKPFDSDLVRPSTKNPNDLTCRLVAHDPDPGNQTPLWPGSFPPVRIEGLRQTNLPYVFNRLYRCVVRDDDTARCKQEYIDRCLLLARQLKVHSMVSEYKGPNPTFTGVDLAVDKGEEHDDTAIFTYERRPGGICVILDIDRGQWAGPETLRKLIAKQKAYNSIVRVESNAAQKYIQQFALQADASMPIKAHMTGRAKAHPEHGVEGFFLEMSNGAWAFPNSPHGVVHPVIKKLIDACLYYTPSKHTDDTLMAIYMAREQARGWGSGPDGASGDGAGSNIGVNILSR